MTSTLIPLVKSQVLSTLFKKQLLSKNTHTLTLQSIQLSVHNIRTQEELIDAVNPSICQHLIYVTYHYIHLLENLKEKTYLHFFFCHIRIVVMSSLLILLIKCSIHLLD